MSDKTENFTEEIEQEWLEKRSKLINAYREGFVDECKKADIDIVPAIPTSEKKTNGIVLPTDEESIKNLLIKKQDADVVLGKIGINKKHVHYKELHAAINNIQIRIDFESSLIDGMFDERIEEMRIMTLNSLKSYKQEASWHIEALRGIGANMGTPNTKKDHSKLPQLILSDLNPALDLLQKSKRKTDQYIEFLNKRSPFVTRYNKSNQPYKHLTSLEIWDYPIGNLYKIFQQVTLPKTKGAQYVAEILIHLYPEIWGKVNKDIATKRVRDRIDRKSN